VSLAVAVGGCGVLIGTPAPQGSDAIISVLVTGSGPAPEEELSLEIGRLAWTVRAGEPGLAGLSAPDPQRVRLVVVPSCEVLAEFDADPGTAHVIRFTDTGDVVAGPRSGSDEPASALQQREPSGCA
jgi:hypothetical protein